MVRILSRAPLVLALSTLVGLIAHLTRNSHAAAPPDQAKHGLTGNYYVGSAGYPKDTLPPDVLQGHGFLQIWTPENDFRLPRAFTPPATTRVDVQVAFGQGKGFHVDPNVGFPPSVVWWPTGYALPPGWAAVHSDISKPWDEFAAVLWKGYIHLPKGGTYYFGTVSNGGSDVHLNQARVALNGLSGGVLNSDAFTYAKELLQDYVQVTGGTYTFDLQPTSQYIIPVTIDGPRDLPIEVRYTAGMSVSGHARNAFGIDLFWVTPDSPRDANGKPVANFVPSDALYTEPPNPIENPAVRSANSMVSADFLYFPAQGAEGAVTLTVRLADKDGNPVRGKRVYISSLISSGSGASDAITQPEKPTDEKGETTAKIRANPGNPGAHDSSIIATDVSDFVDVAQVAHVTFQPQGSFFFPDSFSPYYDPNIPSVEPLPLRQGRPVTIKAPLVNRNKFTAEVTVTFSQNAWNIGASGWSEIGTVKNVRLQPGEHKDVSITWAPEQTTGHICFQVVATGHVLTASQVSGNSLAASLLPPLELAAAFQTATGNSNALTDERRRNLTGVAPNLPDPCEPFFNGDVDPEVTKHLRGNTPFLAVNRASAQVLQEWVQQINDQLDGKFPATAPRNDLEKWRHDALELILCLQNLGTDPGAQAPKPQARQNLAWLQDQRNDAYYSWWGCIRGYKHCTAEDVEFLHALVDELDKEIAAAEGVAKDPPDASYRRLAVARSDTPASYIAAVRVSLERYKGAEGTADSEWMARHLTAMQLYEKVLAESWQRQADAIETRLHAHPLTGILDSATLQTEKAKIFEALHRGDRISPSDLQNNHASGFSDEQMSSFTHALLAAEATFQPKDTQQALHNIAAHYKDLAEGWRQLASTPVSSGAPGERSSPLSQTYAVANPHDKQQTIDLFIRRVSIPADWKLSIVNAEEDQTGQPANKPANDPPKYPVREVAAGEHYAVALPGKAQVQVASVLMPVGEIGAHTTTRWAVEGKIGDQLIGGMVHEMNVPYIIADLQLPPVGSKEGEEELLVPSRNWARVVAEIAAGIVLLGLLTYFLIFWRRRRQAHTV